MRREDFPILNEKVHGRELVYLDNAATTAPSATVLAQMDKINRELYGKTELLNPAVIIDTNHANSGKKYIEQIRIAKEVLHSKRFSEDIGKMVKGLMIESYLEDGNQPIDGCIYGKSITDPCLGWEKSERLIYDIADMV